MNRDHANEIYRRWVDLIACKEPISKLVADMENMLLEVDRLTRIVRQLRGEQCLYCGSNIDKVARSCPHGPRPDGDVCIGGDTGEAV